MRKFILAGVVAATALMSAPASAGVVMNANGSVSTSGAGGGSWTISFDGYGGTSPVVINGLLSSIDFTYVSGGANSYVFSYVVHNDSGGFGITGSRVSGFAFNTNPDIATVAQQGPDPLNASATGLFPTVDTGNYPVGFGNVEFCVTDGGSCAGGGNGGVIMGQTINNTGSFTLNFDSNYSTITLDAFVDRYQSIVGANTQSAIGRQVVTDPVPEPSTWAMMLIGFGAIGFGMRRRQAPKLSQLA